MDVNQQLFLLLCPWVFAGESFSFADAPYKLSFVLKTTPEQSEAVALLQPGSVRVRVANRLVVVS